MHGGGTEGGARVDVESVSNLAYVRLLTSGMKVTLILNRCPDRSRAPRTAARTSFGFARSRAAHSARTNVRVAFGGRNLSIVPPQAVRSRGVP